MKSKNVRLVEINSEIGAGTRGSSLGIAAMKVASLNSEDNGDFFKAFTPHTTIVPNQNHVLFGNKDASWGKNIEAFHTVCENLMAALDATYKGGSFPVVLAGDHSSAAGTIAGIKKAFPDKRLGVIWVDAHADLHSPYTTPSGNIHGMPLAMALAEDNKQEQVRTDVTPTVRDYWEKLKIISGVSPIIQYGDIVFIGVRDTEEQEDKLIERHNIKKITVTDYRRKGNEIIVKETNEYLGHCDLIYLSFDVDSMSHHYVSDGTGTPVPGGFSAGEATKIVTGLLKNEKVCCFEVTEVNPTLDNKGNLMAETAFEILKKSVEVIKNRQTAT